MQPVALQPQLPDCVPVVAELCLCSDQTEMYQTVVSLDLLVGSGTVDLAEMRERVVGKGGRGGGGGWGGGWDGGRFID